MSAAEKVEIPEGLGGFLEKTIQDAVNAGKQQPVTDKTPGGIVTPGTYQLKGKLPPRADQEMWDRCDPEHKGAGIDLVRWAKYALFAKTNGMRIEKVAEELGDERAKAAVISLDGYRKHVESMKSAMGAQTKALAEGTLLDGGALTPPEYSAEFLPLLRNDTVVLQSGARVMEMSGQALNIGRQNNPATAYYVGENQAITASQQQFGLLAFAIKKLGALTGFSNDFLRDGGPAAEQKIRDDLVAIMALKFDYNALRGDGTAGSIKGLRYLTNTANVFAATQAGATATFQEIANDLAQAKYRLRKNNIPLKGWGWVFSPRVEQYLMSVSSTYGVFPFADEMINKGTLRGLPFKVTAALPENLGGGSNETEVYLTAWPQFLIGQNLALEVALFPNGTAPDIGGAMTSGIANDLSWLRAIARHDTQLAYDKACCVITTVKWGA